MVRSELSTLEETWTRILKNVGDLPEKDMAPESFDELRWISDLMKAFPRPWYVAGGWAIDLHVGEVTRTHEDAEIAILRRDQEELRSHLAGWAFTQAIPEERGGLTPWKEGTRLDHPVHEIHGFGPDDQELEVLLNESTGGVWRFRRMMEVARPISKMGHMSPLGLPYLAPEIVLLYKAKEPRAIDEDDFQAARPLLAEEAGEWLRISIGACYPDHPWLASFDEHVQ